MLHNTYPETPGDGTQIWGYIVYRKAPARYQASRGKGGAKGSRPNTTVFRIPDTNPVSNGELIARPPLNRKGFCEVFRSFWLQGI